MAEEPDQHREAIDETRAELAETMKALGEKVDVKAQVAHKLDDSKAQARDELTQLGQKAQEAVPDEVRPVVTATADQVRTATATARERVQRQPSTVWWAVGALVLLLAIRRRSRKRRSQR